PGHVPNLGAATGCVAVLCGDVCLCRMRTRDRRLDVEFFASVSWLGSPYDRCGGGFLVLGLAHGWLSGRDAIAEDIRQPQGAYGAHRRLRGTAERIGISLCYVWVCPQRWLLGTTDDQQCHHSWQEIFC